jgi:ribosome biogenesis protein BRX1
MGKGPKKRRRDVAHDEPPPAPAAADLSADEPQARYPQVARKVTGRKKRVLVLTSRGVTTTFRELMEDLLKLLPHAKKDSKFDKREALTNITEIAELAGCRLCLYFEARKMKDLYLWAAATEGGPSAKFLVQQIKGMGDLRLTGNCLLGSRAILSFDGAFDEAPHLQLLKRLFTAIFAIPKGHARSKPFHDHVMQFAWLGGRVVVRHYQVVPPLNEGSRGDGDTLVEIGPRFALTPIRVLDGSFRGATLYANGKYVSPNEARTELKRKRSKVTRGHVVQKEKRRARVNEHGMADIPDDELDDVFD